MPKVLNNRAERAARLLRVMSQWWDGSRVSEIADEHGLSFQRVYVLLASVGCRWQLRRRKRVSRYADPSWRPPAADVAKARGAVEHPAFRRLPVRQRGALAWRALGLNLPEISARMGSYPAATRDILLAAHWKFERLSRKPDPSPLQDCARQVIMRPFLRKTG